MIISKLFLLTKHLQQPAVYYTIFLAAAAVQCFFYDLANGNPDSTRDS